MQQDMHLHCCASLVLSFFILYHKKCYMCCDGRNRNEVKINNTYSVECNASIQTTWANKNERKKSADLWDCLQMKTCSVNVTKSKNNTCLCTKKLCAKSKCSVLKKDCNQLTVTCKMDTVPANYDDCLTSVTDELTEQHIYILGKDTCIKHRKKEYEVNEIHLSIRDFSDTQTYATLNLEKQNNSLILDELKDAVSDLLISTESHRSVIVVSEKSSVFLCFTGINKNICIIAKCKETEKCFTNNDPKSKGTEDMQFSFANIWKLWKDEIVLIVCGILMFGGIVGFLFGMIFARRRKMNLNTEDNRRHPRHTCNSELYAEIRESVNITGKDRDETISEEVELENNIKRSASDDMVSTDTSRHSIDCAYSNIYNVLQHNYGQRRNSYPIDDKDTKDMFNKYYSLERLDVSNKSDDQLHIQDKTPISIGLSN